MEAMPGAPSRSAAIENGSIRIAIGDDQPILRQGLRVVLSEAPGFQVVAEAGTGRQVLEILREQQPDILLLELLMRDSLSTLQALQAESCPTRIIILTASEDQCELVQAVRWGAAGIVQKQAATALLIKSIRKVHGGETWLDLRTTAAIMKQFATPPGAPAKRGASLLTPREQEVLAFVARGLRNKQIAAALFISEQTVKNHVHNMCESLGVTGRLELVLHAIERKLLSAEQ